MFKLLENIIENRTYMVLGAIVLALYVAYIIARNLKPAKSDYEQEIDRIMNSDKHKVKGRFE